MKKIYPLILVSFLGTTFLKAQTTVTLTAVNDNTLYSQSSTVSNGSGDYIFAGLTASGDKRRSLLRFDLSGIPSTAVITSATLKLSCNRLARASAGISFHKLTSDWGEGSSNANAQEGGGAPANTNDATSANRFFPGTNWTNAGGDFLSTPTGIIGSVTAGANDLVGNSGSLLVADIQGFVTTPATNFGWIVLGSNENQSQSALRFASRENPNTSEKPILEVTYTNTLPVRFGSFTGAISKGQADLIWETLSEEKNDFFQIEHSTNGQSFSAVGTVAGNGTSNLRNQYAFTHANITDGKHYYRIAQYDFDGRKSYSKVIVLSTTGILKLDIYPNPTQDLIRMNTPFAPENQTYRIVNISGQPVQQGKLSGQQLNISGMPAGIYILSVLGPEGIWYRSKFIKK